MYSPLPNVRTRVRRTDEPSDVHSGSVTWCHPFNSRVCQISALLNVPLQILCAFTVKWKRLGRP